MKALSNATFLTPPGWRERNELRITFQTGEERDDALHDLQRLRSGLLPAGQTLVATPGLENFVNERRHIVDALGFLYVKACEPDMELAQAHARLAVIAGIASGLLKYLKVEPPLTFAELGRGLVR
jgi:hypothetical protein